MPLGDHMAATDVIFPVCTFVHSAVTKLAKFKHILKTNFDAKNCHKCSTEQGRETFNFGGQEVKDQSYQPEICY